MIVVADEDLVHSDFVDKVPGISPVTREGNRSLSPPDARANITPLLTAELPHPHTLSHERRRATERLVKKVEASEAAVQTETTVSPEKGWQTKGTIRRYSL